MPKIIFVSTDDKAQELTSSLNTGGDENLWAMRNPTKHIIKAIKTIDNEMIEHKIQN